MELYKTKGVCSREIAFSIENGIIETVRFTGGCDGNIRAIEKLVKGMSAQETIEKLKGIRCGAKSTSCPDQLAQALELYCGKK